MMTQSSICCMPIISLTYHWWSRRHRSTGIRSSAGDSWDSWRCTGSGWCGGFISILIIISGLKEGQWESRGKEERKMSGGLSSVITFISFHFTGHLLTVGGAGGEVGGEGRPGGEGEPLGRPEGGAGGPLLLSLPAGEGGAGGPLLLVSPAGGEGGAGGPVKDA